MYAKILFILLLLVSMAGRAATTVEASVGVSASTPQHNGIWYQKGFPYQLHTTTNTVSLGLRTDVTDHIALHAAAYRFGNISSDAWAVTHDALYDAQSPTHCPTVCPPLAHYMGRGWSGGVRLLADFHTTGPWQVGFLIGPIFYRSTWTMNVPDWFQTMPAPGGYTRGPVEPVHIKATRWATAQAIGLRLAHGRQYMELMLYRDGASLQRGDYYPPIWRNHLALSYGFTF